MFDVFLGHLLGRGNCRGNGVLNRLHVGNDAALNALRQLVSRTDNAHLTMLVDAGDKACYFARSYVQSRENVALLAARLVKQPFCKAAHLFFPCRSPAESPAYSGQVFLGPRPQDSFPESFGL